nr:calphotin [Helicoverpa armigera]
MKYFLAIALLVAVASAAMVKPTPVSAEIAEIQEIIAAIQSPSTDPATAVALEAMLLDVLGIKPEPIAVGPAIVDFPLPDGGVIPEPVLAPSPLPIAPSPVAIIPGPAAAEVAASTPLVQIILNINQAAAGSNPISVGPAVIPEPIIPTPVQVVESAPEPVQVVEVAPVPVEPVIIGTPVLPEAAITLPEELN